MAGSSIAMPANAASDWSNFVTIVERNLRGWMALSLTNIDNTSEPAVAAGSAVEVGGTVYAFDIEEAITGWGGISNSEDVWIKVVPSGSSITAAFTTTPPTWSDAKQGWYDGVDRYVAWLLKDAAGDYTPKQILEDLAPRVQVPTIQALGDLILHGELVGGMCHAGANIAVETPGDYASTSNAGYTRLLEVIVPYTGVITIDFDHSSTGDFESKTQVYKNGVAHGTERSHSLSAPTTWSEDLYFEAGDLCQVYGKLTVVAPRARYLKIKSDVTARPILDAIYQTCLVTYDPETTV